MVVGRQLGRAIKSRRRNLGQTQPTAAAAIEALVRMRHPDMSDQDVRVTATQVSDWENGKSLPHTLKFGALSDWLGEPLAAVERMAEDAQLPEDQQDEYLIGLVERMRAEVEELRAEVNAMRDERVELRRKIGTMKDALIEQQATLLKLLRGDGGGATR